MSADLATHSKRGRWWRALTEDERRELQAKREREARLAEYRRLFPWLDSSI